MKKTLLKTDQNNPYIKAYVKAIKQGMKSQHVVPSSDGWAVKKGGTNIVTKTFKTQSEAQKFASQIAKTNKASLFVHARNGMIRLRRDY